MDLSNSELKLYTFFRSTSSARVRIAAHLKGIHLDYVYVNLRKAEQFEDKFGLENPNHTVPVLAIAQTDSSGEPILIRQSIAILEFFEEAFPKRTPLLPPPDDLLGRARVREAVNLIACDVQPPTNQRILKRIKQFGPPANMEEWAKEIMTAGLVAFERLIESGAGRYCYGDKITLADVVLVPAVENATRYGFELESCPTIKKVFDNASENPAFRAGNWRRQGDTPLDERED
jgi:maleylacetoacetate isomerase